MPQNQFQVTFKGVRGSIPTPLTSAQVEEKIVKSLELAKPEDLGDSLSIKAFVDRLPIQIKGCFGGNSSCVLAEVEGHNLVFDAGTGLRELGLEWMTREFSRGEGRAHIFFSHTHMDHILGIPFFAPFYVPGNKFTFYAVHKDLMERLAAYQQPQYFPIPFKAFRSDIDFIHLKDLPSRTVGNATVSWKKNYHPGQSFAFRVDYQGRSFVYATDSEYKKISPADLKPEIEFFKDADLLIFDSQYTFVEGIEDKSDWGHSSTFIGIDIALASNVKQIAFFHHEPTYSDFKLMDILQQSRKYLKAINPASPPKMFFAHEGLTVDLMNP